MAQHLTVSLIITILSLFTSGVSSTTFTLTNKCNHTIWPGILSNAGVPPFPTTGFALSEGDSETFPAPSAWGGRFWARTHCTMSTGSRLTCVTGDCGSGKLECSGNGATPPATLAEFTLSGAGGLDFFDVSLVDGYNVAMLVEPNGGGGSGQNCTSTGCVADLNGSCPNELKVMSSDKENVACKSACEAFQSPEYCCSGAYGTPDTCEPSSYSRVFKSACPRAYSYAYDDMTSTFTCASADYTITFCPERSTSLKSESPAPTSTSSQDQQQQPEGTSSSKEQPVTDSTMVYQGAWEVSAASPSTRVLACILHAIVGLVSFLAPL